MNEESRDIEVCLVKVNGSVILAVRTCPAGRSLLELADYSLKGLNKNFKRIFVYKQDQEK